MFEIKIQLYGGTMSYIVDNIDKYLHSDGSATKVVEYFETPVDAQKVLDKFYPKLKHVWEHGDVFETDNNNNIMMYHKFTNGRKSEAICVVGPCGGPSLDLRATMKNAKFLFNIKEKI